MTTPISEETVAALADLVGVKIEPERCAAAAEGLALLLGFANELNALDLGDAEPGLRFSAAWESEA